ncbi:hypothetical protein HYE69_01880 [Staphylococcus sp. GSSP0090]|nr:hypothetical protein [Staphylococcus sp. GSSP0090]
MQLYLKDGHEIRDVIFNEADVRRYNAFFHILEEDIVPPLYCAKLWPEFTLFEPFQQKEIILRETEVTQIQAIEVNVHYSAQMVVLERKKVRQFMKYVLKLEIYKNKYKCITIRQTFMEKI